LQKVFGGVCAEWSGVEWSVPLTAATIVVR